MASNLEEALVVARGIGYPLMVRPSYVLGGRGMEVVHDEEMLRASNCFLQLPWSPCCL